MSPPVRPHILLVISSLAGGGAARVMTELGAFLKERGYAITLATLEGSAEDGYPVAPGINRVRIDIIWKSRGPLDSLLGTVRRLRMIRRMVRQSGADLVISFIAMTNVRVLLALVGTHIPVIVSERSDPRHEPIGRFWDGLRRCSYPLARCVVLQTQGVVAWAGRFLSRGAIEVIPNAVRSATFAREGPRPRGMPTGPVILGAGRLTRQKGFDILIRAFARSALQSSGWDLVILGEGDDRPGLVNLVEELALTGHVHLPGTTRSPEGWLRHAGIFALSSRYEGFPNVLLEAMQCGVPVVAFDCESGPGEIIRHGQDGWLVPPGDVEALGDALRRLANDADLRDNLARAAVSVATRFSIETVYGRWQALCDTMAAFHDD